MKETLKRTLLTISLIVIPTSYADVAVFDTTVDQDIGHMVTGDAGSVRGNQYEQYMQFQDNIDTKGTKSSTDLEEGSVRLNQSYEINQTDIRTYKKHIIDPTNYEPIYRKTHGFVNDMGSIRKNQAYQIQMLVNTDISSSARKRLGSGSVQNTDRPMRGQWAMGADGQALLLKTNLGNNKDTYFYHNYLNSKPGATTYELTTLPSGYNTDELCVETSGLLKITGKCAGYLGKSDITGVSLNGALQNSILLRQDLKVKFDTTTSDIAKLIEAEAEKNARQIAIYQAMSQEAYMQASVRFETLQQLMNEIDKAEEPKDIWDLQTRIQAEQMMLQNEQVKLTALSQLQQSQKDMYDQRKIEMNNFRRNPENKYAQSDIVDNTGATKGDIKNSSSPGGLINKKSEARALLIAVNAAIYTLASGTH